MREIKFRAWHEEEKKMWADVGTDGFGGIILDTENMGLKPLKGKAIIMQFTGLLDKNGKEIYEGDIYCQEVWMFGDSEGLQVGEIVYDTSRFCVKYPWGASVLRFTGEVIGNIYENPELLEKK
uniref:Putative YopX protein n=1 Tax=viral metagenome TaxID=1070528 RepID=A0A6M3JSU8_9ZZZZ